MTDGESGGAPTTARRDPGLRITGACPRNAPGQPSIANDRHQQQPANMKLARALNLRATYGNTLVMRRSSPRRAGSKLTTAAPVLLSRLGSVLEMVQPRDQRPVEHPLHACHVGLDGSPGERLRGRGSLRSYGASGSSTGPDLPGCLGSSRIGRRSRSRLGHHPTVTGVVAGYPSRSAAVKILSMTSAPVVMTGRSSCR